MGIVGRKKYYFQINIDKEHGDIVKSKRSVTSLLTTLSIHVFDLALVI